MPKDTGGKPRGPRVGFAGLDEEPRLSVDIYRQEEGDKVPEMKAPKKAPKKVLLKSESFASEAEQSVAASATSGASSGLFGGGVVGDAGLGMQVLQRDEWSAKVLYCLGFCPNAGMTTSGNSSGLRTPFIFGV